MAKQTRPENPEVVNASPSTPETALLKNGATIMRLENDVQMAVAIQRKRNEADILKACINSLDLYPEFADKVIFNKPVGKDDNGDMKYATGLSIRAAEALRIRWGNNACGAQILGEDDMSVTLAVVYLDYESNNRTCRIKRVSKFYKTRNGQVVEHPPDRFADIVLPANQSKAMRNAILENLPPELKAAYEQKARQLMRKEKPVSRLNKMTTAFHKIEATDVQLEKLMGKKLPDFTEDDIDQLQGIYVALRDGETTFDEVFGPKAAKDEQPAKLKVKPVTIAPEHHAQPSEDLRPKYICDRCNRLAVEPITLKGGQFKCPFDDCGEIGYTREATEQDYYCQGYK